MSVYVLIGVGATSVLLFGSAWRRAVADVRREQQQRRLLLDDMAGRNKPLLPLLLREQPDSSRSIEGGVDAGVNADDDDNEAFLPGIELDEDGEVVDRGGGNYNDNNHNDTALITAAAARGTQDNGGQHRGTEPPPPSTTIVTSSARGRPLPRLFNKEVLYYALETAYGGMGRAAFYTSE
jgi:hypothetical protein